MAAGRSGKIPPVRARAGLFLTEALVGIVIFATLAGAVVISCVDIKALYTDRQSDENIARDVRALQFWLEDVLQRAVSGRVDFELLASEMTPTAKIRLKWKYSPAVWEVWSGDECAVRAGSSGEPSSSFNYNHLTQTLTPGIELVYYIKKGGSWALTKWRISVSPYGYVRIYKIGG